MNDLVILNGMVIDGTGTPGKFVNIGIKGDKIAEISEETLLGKKIIDASGYVVAPGFIDVHGHSDLVPLMSGEFFSKIYQGVSTEINGNCGITVIPSKTGHISELKKYVEDDLCLIPENYEYGEINSFGELKYEIEKAGMIHNYALLIGGGSLRIGVMGFDNRKATVKEMERMKEILERELQMGAKGISFGLIYPPGNFTDSGEIIELLKIIAEYDRIAAFHMRNEGADVLNSVREVIEVSKSSGARVHISHLKIMNKVMWGKSREIIEMIREGNLQGAKVTFDQYPYEASSTTLQVLLPEELFSLGIENMVENLGLDTEILKEIESRIESRGGAERITISDTYGTYKEIEGKTLQAAADILGVASNAAVIELIRKTGGRVSAVYFSMNEIDIDYIMGQEGMVGSDGYTYPITREAGMGNPHPRSFGTFPRYLKMVREKNLLSLEKAVAKITSIPAEVFKIRRRGVLKPKNYADIVIFKWEELNDTSTFEKPFGKSEGIEYLIINGKVVLEKGKALNEKVGKFLRA